MQKVIAGILVLALAIVGGLLLTTSPTAELPTASGRWVEVMGNQRLELTIAEGAGGDLRGTAIQAMQDMTVSYAVTGVRTGASVALHLTEKNTQYHPSGPTVGLNPVVVQQYLRDKEPETTTFSGTIAEDEPVLAGTWYTPVGPRDRSLQRQ